MVTAPRFLLAAAMCCCFLAVTAYAQDPADLPSAPPAAPPANLAYVDGAVDVVQDGVVERADAGAMLVAGDMVRTRDGRAEIVFDDGTLLHLGSGAELEVLDGGHLRLISGRAIVRLSTGAPAYVIDTPAATVRLQIQGEYSVTTDRSSHLDVGVARGSARVDGSPSWTLATGQMLTLEGPDARPLIQPFNSARFDAFAQWSYERAHAFASSSSATQLPYELRAYAPVFDDYGRWDYVAPHGYVWFPAVAVGWRPYWAGSWGFTRYGWTWHGLDRWAYPTHHYGRWGFSGSAWYWIPASVWGPAWVSWSYTAGYVGWAPLGWDNRPAIGFYRADHPAYWPDYRPWRAWTVVPRNHFGPRRDVRADAIDGTRLDEPARTALATAILRTPARDIAVPRTGAAVPGADGFVRRPTRVYPSGGAGSIGSPAGVARSPRDPRTGVANSGDDPVYARPRTGEAGEARTGRTRDPRAYQSPATTGAGERDTARPRPQPDAQSSGAAPPDGSRRSPRAYRPTPNDGAAGGGAVQRGGAARSGADAAAASGGTSGTRSGAGRSGAGATGSRGESGGRSSAPRAGAVRGRP